MFLSNLGEHKSSNFGGKLLAANLNVFSIRSILDVYKTCIKQKLPRRLKTNNKKTSQTGVTVKMAKTIKMEQNKKIQKELTYRHSHEGCRMLSFKIKQKVCTQKSGGSNDVDICTNQNYVIYRRIVV